MGIYRIKYAALSELLHARITRRQGRATRSVGLGIKVDCKSAASSSVISLQLVSSMSDKAATNKVRLGAVSAHLAVQFVTQGCSTNKPCTCAPLGPCDAQTSTGRLVVLEAQVGRWCGRDGPTRYYAHMQPRVKRKARGSTALCFVPWVLPTTQTPNRSPTLAETLSVAAGLMAREPVASGSTW